MTDYIAELSELEKTKGTATDWYNHVSVMHRSMPLWLNLAEVISDIDWHEMIHHDAYAVSRVDADRVIEALKALKGEK